MKQGKITLLTAMTVTIFGLSACGSNGNDSAEPGEAETGGAADADMEVAMVSKGFQHQFWQAVYNGAEEKAEELGVAITFDGPPTETEVEQQLEMLQTAVDRQPDAIAYAALDPEACVPLLEEADSADIPVVEFDEGCNESDVPLSLARTDNTEAGALAAENMAELLDGEGEVGIVGHSQIDSTGIDRRDGFVETLESDYPNIEVVDIQYGDGDHLESADIANAMLAANPDIEGLYGTNEGSAIGIVNAANELGLDPDEISIIGFDSGQAQIEAIESGMMDGAVTQDPMGIGRVTVEAAVAAINGEELEEEVDTGSYWYDAENIDDDDIQELIYE